MRYVPPLGAQDPDAPYIDGNPAQGIEGSPVPAAALEHVQREVVYTIEKSGLVPDENDLTQLAQAIQRLFDKNLGLNSSVDPTPNTIPMRGPNGEIRAGEPRVAEDVARLTELGETKYYFPSGDFFQLIENVPYGKMGIAHANVTNKPVPVGVVFWKVKEDWDIAIHESVFIRTFSHNQFWWTQRNITSGANWQGWQRIDSGGAFPSGQTITLSVPASGGNVVMPGNGWLRLSGQANITQGHLALSSGGIFNQATMSNGSSITIYIPVSSGSSTSVSYSGATGLELVFVRSIGGQQV